jgi:hypothetical protein
VVDISEADAVVGGHLLTFPTPRPKSLDRADIFDLELSLDETTKIKEQPIGMFIPRFLRFKGYKTKDIRENHTDSVVEIVLERRFIPLSNWR